jgi:hypothetical protein
MACLKQGCAQAKRAASVVIYVIFVPRSPSLLVLSKSWHGHINCLLLHSHLFIHIIFNASPITSYNSIEGCTIVTSVAIQIPAPHHVRHHTSGQAAQRVRRSRPSPSLQPVIGSHAQPLVWYQKTVLTPTRLLSRSMVDLYVGPSNTHWILHEKLLCHHSPYFRRIFYKKNSKASDQKTFGLPDEEDHPFKTLVGWLYSSSLPVPREEADLSMLFDLYLMSEKFEMAALIADVLQVVREWYKYSDTYPGLRRVQYIYANTEEGSPMRHMLVHAVARLMVIEKGIPTHWDKALRKNGQLAVDIIKAIQDWKLDEEVIPDSRDDPAEAEDLIDVEADLADAEEAGQAEAEQEEDEEEEVEGEAEEGDEEVEDDSEATVVDSPSQPQHSEPAKDSKKKGDSMISGFKKMALQTVPNGLTNGDYGTLAH